MKLSQLIIITVHLTGIFSKKKHKRVSSESIENILYYQDCNHKQKPAAPVALKGPPPPLHQECKMSCTMCCGDQCTDTDQAKLTLGGRQAGIKQIEPKDMMPVMPGVMPPRERRKKQKFPMPMQPPLPGRRGLGFTRENIKSLISHDEDIRKILKDLVMVTMQKMDLVQLMNSRPADVKPVSERADVSESENDL